MSATPARPERGRRFGGWKLEWSFTIPTIILVMVLIGVTMMTVHFRLRTSLSNDLDLRGLSMARSIGAVATPSLLAYNYAALQLAAEAASQDTGVAYVVLHDKEGMVAGEAGRLFPPAAGKRPAEAGEVASRDDHARGPGRAGRQRAGPRGRGAGPRRGGRGELGHDPRRAVHGRDDRGAPPARPRARGDGPGARVLRGRLRSLARAADHGAPQAPGGGDRSAGGRRHGAPDPAHRGEGAVRAGRGLQRDDGPGAGEGPRVGAVPAPAGQPQREPRAPGVRADPRAAGVRGAVQDPRRALAGRDPDRAGREGPVREPGLRDRLRDPARGGPLSLVRLHVDLRGRLGRRRPGADRGLGARGAAPSRRGPGPRRLGLRAGPGAARERHRVPRPAGRGVPPDRHDGNQRAARASQRDREAPLARRARERRRARLQQPARGDPGPRAAPAAARLRRGGGRGARGHREGGARRPGDGPPDPGVLARPAGPPLQVRSTSPRSCATPSR